MIVIDASALLEMLFGSPTGQDVAVKVRNASVIASPQLVIVECLQVIRRAEARHAINTATAAELVRDLLALDLDLYDHQLVALRIWELRANLTAYDASYVALSELLKAPLVTTDEKMANAPGNRAQIDLVS
jgi:predicted nucleic acid-binding protein